MNACYIMCVMKFIVLLLEMLTIHALICSTGGTLWFDLGSHDTSLKIGHFCKKKVKCWAIDYFISKISSILAKSNIFLILLSFIIAIINKYLQCSNIFRSRCFFNKLKYRIENHFIGKKA